MTRIYNDEIGLTHDRLKNEIVEYQINKKFKTTRFEEDPLIYNKLSLNSPYLRAMCNKLYKKFGKLLNETRQEFEATFVDLYFESALKLKGVSRTDIEGKLAWYMNSFEVKEGFQYLDAAMDSYAYKFIDNKLKDEVKARNNAQTVKKDGSRILLTFVTESEQLKEGGSAFDYLAEEDNMYANVKYKQTHFAKWFRENAEKILTKKQYHNLQKIKDLDINSMSAEDVKELTGIEKKNINRTLERMIDRVIKAYNKQKPAQISDYHQELIDILNVLNPIIELIYDEEIDASYLNEVLFDYVFSHFEDIQYNLSGCLTAEQNQNMIRKVKDTKALYAICLEAENKVERIKQRLYEDLVFADGKLERHGKVVSELEVNYSKS